MAESTFAWLSVVVKRAENVIKPREIMKCSWTDTFGSLLLKYGSDVSSERVSHVVISKNEKFIDPCHRVPADAPLSVCDQFGCLNVCVYLESSTTISLTTERTVTSVLMERSREIVLPQPLSVSPDSRTLRADQRLRNDILGECMLLSVSHTHTHIHRYTPSPIHTYHFICIVYVMQRNSVNGKLAGAEIVCLWASCS